MPCKFEDICALLCKSIDDELWVINRSVADCMMLKIVFFWFDLARKRRARARGYMFARVYVSHGYMVCARARIAWLHGLPIALALALPRVAGSASFNAVAFLVIIIITRTKKHLKNEQRNRDDAAKKRANTSGVGESNNYYDDIYFFLYLLTTTLTNHTHRFHLLTTPAFC